jgi:hypothetical protein
MSSKEGNQEVNPEKKVQLQGKIIAVTGANRGMYNQFILSHHVRNNLHTLYKKDIAT